MITTEHRERFVAITVLGEFTLADFKEFEQLFNYKIQFEGKVDVLFDLRAMVGVTLDVAWEELKFTRQHAGDFRRIALVTDDQWLGWSAWLRQFFIDGELQIFADEAAARAWLEVDETRA